MLNKAKNIFMVGIGGSAMCNLAIILKKMGKQVTGSDASTIAVTDKILEENDISFVTNFKPESIPEDTDLVIYSGSFNGAQNAQVQEAVKRNILTASLAEINGELTKIFKKSIAVCGTHGKTTTASLLAYSLKRLGANISYLIGTSTFNEYYGGGYEGDDYFVIEADEYAVNPPYDKTPKFHLLHPKYVICSNIDFDHPDVYTDLKDTQKEFRKFFDTVLNSSEDSKLFICLDNTALMEVVKDFPRDRYVMYGYAENADVKIINAKSTENYSIFELIYNGKSIGEFSLSIFGSKNISNAAGVIACLLHIGFNQHGIEDAVKGFYGAKRRFEQIAYINDTYLFDDYAHNPQKVETAILAAKERFKTRRVIVIFQPHTFSRTLALKNEFVSALSKADYSLVTPIFASARERQEDYPITSHDIITAAREQGITTINTYEDFPTIAQALAQILRKGDIIMTVGAGDIYKMKNDIIHLMQNIK